MEDLLNYLKENFSEATVTEMLDEEILNWIDDDWGEDYENEHDWYLDHNNNEAEDNIVKQIINDAKKSLPNLDVKIDIEEVLKELYRFLDN